jgi:glycosyltransferase involved in cell wall biosynthesis
MKIGLNATCFNDRPSGAKQRFIGLYSELFQNMSNSRFIIYEPQDCLMSKWFPELDNIEFKKTLIPSEGRINKYLIGLTYWKELLKKEKLDFLEGFNLPNVSVSNEKRFQTIHDIRSIYKDFSLFERTLSRSIHLKSIHSSDHIITVSESMRMEINQLAPNANVTVIYNGIDASQFLDVSDNEIQEFRSQFKLPSQFILSIGHFERRKNYLNLINAIKILKDRGFDCPLLIVGNDNGEKQKILNKIQIEGLDKQIFLFSGLTDVQVKYLYKLSNAFVFPSLYEGFGIPILESMASGTPIIMSNLEVFQEIMNGQGVHFNQHSPISIADSIEATLSNSDLIFSLKHYGQERIKDFSFTKLAQKLKLLYKFHY